MLRGLRRAGVSPSGSHHVGRRPTLAGTLAGDSIRKRDHAPAVGTISPVDSEVRPCIGSVLELGENDQLLLRRRGRSRSLAASGNVHLRDLPAEPDCCEDFPEQACQLSPFGVRDASPHFEYKTFQILECPNLDLQHRIRRIATATLRDRLRAPAIKVAPRSPQNSICSAPGVSEMAADRSPKRCRGPS